MRKDYNFPSFVFSFLSFISILFLLSDFTGGNGTIYTLPLMGVKVPPLHHNPFHSVNIQSNTQLAGYVATSVCRPSYSLGNYQVVIRNIN